MTAPLLQVENLCIYTGTKALVTNLSFSIYRGGRHGLIGESGSGKSLTSLAILRLLPKTLQYTGAITLGGRTITNLDEKSLNSIRGHLVAPVFQEPLSALDPLMRINKQIAIPLQRHTIRTTGSRLSKISLQKGVDTLLDQVSLPQRAAQAYPFELSGGQRQRAAIAMALACSPQLLIADEPTTALDVTTQAEILSLLDRLVQEKHMALLFISHDLPVVARVVDTLTVMHQGSVVESGSLIDVYRSPQNDYTKRLIAAARSLDSLLPKKT